MKLFELSYEDEEVEDEEFYLLEEPFALAEMLELIEATNETEEATAP